MSWVHCSKLVVNSFEMPIYYKRMEPFNSLVVSGSSWGLIACCQKGRSRKSSPSLLIVGLLFNSSRLCEAAFFSTLLGGFKEVFKELNSWGRSQCEFNGECISSGPLSVASLASAAELIVAAHRNRFGEQLVALMLALALEAAPVLWMDLGATSALLGAELGTCRAAQGVQVSVVGLPAPSTVLVHPVACLLSNPVCEPPKFKPVGRSGLLERLSLSLPTLVVRDCLLTSRARLPKESHYCDLSLELLYICIWHMKSCKMQLVLCCIFD